MGSESKMDQINMNSESKRILKRIYPEEERRKEPGNLAILK